MILLAYPCQALCLFTTMALYPTSQLHGPPHFRFRYRLVQGPGPSPSWSSWSSSFQKKKQIISNQDFLKTSLTRRVQCSHQWSRAMHFGPYFLKKHQCSPKIRHFDIFNHVDESRMFGIVQKNRVARSPGRSLQKRMCTHSNGDKSVYLISRTQ